VGYPIINLDRFEIGVREYIFRLEEAVIHTLAQFNITASRLEGAIGVWLDPEIKGKSRKICAIGVRASRGVTMHGFAFNVNTDLRFFDYINPCGFTDRGVTSMEKELGSAQDIGKVKTVLKSAFTAVFDCEINS
jgi:lipoyl(octanoyl) transferase